MVEVGKLVEQSILELQQAAHLALQLLEKEAILGKGLCDKWLQINTLTKYHDVAK